jgi:hypothetical protein
VAEKDATGNGCHEPREARIAAEAGESADDRLEGLLGEVLGVCDAADATSEVPAERVDAVLEEEAYGRRIAGSRALDPLGVVDR